MHDIQQIVRFDHHSPEYRSSFREIIEDLQKNSPVAYSEAHGGFWIVTRYDDVKHIGENWEQFSSENRVAQNDPTRRGVMIPQLAKQLTLNENDPPLHTQRRMIVTPYFAPKYLSKWVQAAAHYTARAFDDIIESGKVEFIDDICLRIPAMTTLHVAGVDPEEWQLYTRPATFYGPDGAERAQAEIMDKLAHVLEERRREPRIDIASALANAVIDGEPMPTEVAAGMLHTIVTGGFDTATAMFTTTLGWLSNNPDRRQHLREHPELHENAVEEFLRMFTPLHNLARSVTQDLELRGQHLKAGDRVLMSLYGANHDPLKFSDPYVIDFERDNARDHVSYSSGNHRCLGSPLARLELRHLLGQVLERIPDFTVDWSRSVRNATIGVIDGWDRMHATFTPGPKSA